MAGSKFNVKALGEGIVGAFPIATALSPSLAHQVRSEQRRATEIISG